MQHSAQGSFTAGQCLNSMIVISIFISVLFGGALLAEKPAYADTQLNVGTYVALKGVPNSSDYADGLLSLKVKSSNTKVVSCTVVKPEDYTGTKEYFAHARGFGQATVNATWKVAQNVYDKKSGKITQKTKSYSKTFKYSVESAKIKARYCDELYAGRSYSVSNLFKSCSDANGVTYLPGQTDGVFTAGAGYTVSSNGKKVSFDSAGKGIELHYEVDGVSYTISVGAVHSKESVASRVCKLVKKAAYIPTSFKLKSVGFQNGKVIVTFSLKNLAGVTKTSKVSAGFFNGSFKWEKVSS